MHDMTAVVRKPSSINVTLLAFIVLPQKFYDIHQMVSPHFSKKKYPYLYIMVVHDHLLQQQNHNHSERWSDYYWPLTKVQNMYR